MNKLKQKIADDVDVCVLNLLSNVSTLPIIVVKGLKKVEIIPFQIVTLPDVDHVIKESCDLVGAFQGKSPP